MSKRIVVHIILWVVAVVCIGLAFYTFYQWSSVRGGSPDDPGRFHWIIWAAGAVICIAIWFFTREKEEEISITRGS
jgi:hypothetical protein